MNLKIYTTEMAKSVWDKAFFMDKIPGAKCIIDFGCADGAMIRYLSSLYPDITFIGYDINMVLIDKARKTPPFNANLIYFCGIWEGLNDLWKYVFDHFKKQEICINFSSVLHEVYSSTGGIDIIQKLVSKLEPRYITIRDMYCDEFIPFVVSHNEHQLIDAFSADKKLEKHAREFTKTFGPIMNWRDMTHMLMKLQWMDNGWEDELKENYYSWTIDKFIDDIGGNYITSFECRYQLPYLSEKWKKEYEWYNPDIHTHAQFILRRAD